MAGQRSERSGRHRLRVTIRTLIVAVLLIGGWLTWVVRSARLQLEAVAAIQRPGGLVRYDWQWKNGECRDSVCSRLAAQPSGTTD